VQDREARADESRNRLVEGDQLGRREIAGPQAIPVEQDWPDIPGADPLAFHRQKRELFNGVQRAKVRAEFEAIDNPRLRSQMNVLRTKIAVAFYHLAAIEPLQQ